MATVFPFNKIPTIPLTIVSVLLPAFLKQKKYLNKLVSDIEQKVEGLSKNVSCDDAEINSIKQDLTNLQQVVQNIQRISNLLQPISSGLQTATTIANIVIPIQLAIPSVVGVPEGPKEQLILALAELLQNITVILNILNNIVSSINNINDQVTGIVSLAQSKLNSICNNTESDISSTNGNLESQVSTIDQEGLQSPELNSEYPSEFYRDINVSNDDLQNRIDQIQNLVDEQLNVLQNLVEAPSIVITDAGRPEADLGKVGDYYIDTNTQTVYGPKPTQNSWT